ncbi:MAG: chromosome partitioning protein ParB [Proteobacteria bacterium]|nr:MAG: chromosome partitioning protein ParB [Pseudomonadota bacterium]
MADAPKFDFGEPFAGFEHDGVIRLWITSRLWKLAAELPTFEYDVSSFENFDEDVWFNTQNKPTVNKVLEHYRKIQNADFSFPIILSRDGIILDGVHRICRAQLDGRKTIPAVRFETDPEPDRIHRMDRT